MIQYSLDGSSWTDVPNSEIEVGNDSFTSGVIENLDLPNDLDNQDDVYLRWVNSSNTSIGGDEIASGGNSRIIDIVVSSGDYVEPAPEFTEVSNIEALLQDASAGDLFEITGEVVVTYYAGGSRNQFFIQDDTGAILIDDDSGTITTEFVEGDGITGLQGEFSVFSGTNQFVPQSDPGSPSSQDNDLPIVDLTLDELSADNQSQLVRVTGVTFDGIDSGALFEGGENYDIVDASLQAEETVTFRTAFEDADYIGESIPTQEFELVAIAAQFNGSPQLTARNSEDFGIVPPSVEAPSFDPEPGIIDAEEVEITITAEDENAVIYYTLDGSDPNNESTEYTAPFTVTESTTVKAIAYVGEDASSISTGEYQFPVEATIADARAADEGTLVEVVGIVNSNDFGFGVADYFVQDNTAGINITDFDTGGNRSGTVVAPGDSIRIVGETAVFENQKNIEVSEFEIINSENPLPEPQVITAANFTAESDLQGSRVLLENVTITDAGEEAWPTEPFTGNSSGANVEFENENGDTFIIRIARNNTFYASGDISIPQGPVNITGTMGQFGDDTQLFPFFEGDISPVPTQVQIIHNSADPAVESVDIYVEGDLTLEDVEFRTATGFIELPSNKGLEIGVTPTGESLDSGVTFSNVFFEPGNYYVVASGVLDPSGFAPNPGEEDTEFELTIIDGAETEAADEDTFSFRLHHGVTDAPAVDIDARDVAELATDVSYGSTTSEYTDVPVGSYTIDISPAGGDVFASVEADANELGGETGLVLASGFLMPENNQDGEPFGALLVLADGTTVLLPSVSTSIDEQTGLPQQFALEQNYPNPFNPNTQIEYALPQASNVKITVYNVVGQQVATLLNNEQQSAGYHSVSFDASSLASGMYLYRIEAGSFVQTKKMTLIK